MGNCLYIKIDVPNKTFVHVRKKKVGPKKYRQTIKINVRSGKRSKKNEKNKISAINIIEPGKPKKTNKFNNATKNNLGQIKLIPLISVTNRVLNRRPIASTNKNEFVESSA